MPASPPTTFSRGVADVVVWVVDPEKYADAAVHDTMADYADDAAAGDSIADGDWDWVYTEMYMGINHEVAPSTDALTCTDCHFDAAGWDWTALGYACDLLAAQGGTGVLAETPEIYGAEHLLTRRAATQATGDKLIGLIKWWEDYTARNKGSMDNNPSPGNKAGGLTTILEKSLGAAAKGGTTPLTGVYQYAETVTARGFTFMDTPGNDWTSVTGQVAGGCTLVFFVTGRGSAFGFKPSPVIKIASNSTLYRRMEDDMDVNAGAVVEEGKTIDEVGQEIFELAQEKGPLTEKAYLEALANSGGRTQRRLDHRGSDG